MQAQLNIEKLFSFFKKLKANMVHKETNLMDSVVTLARLHREAVTGGVGYVSWFSKTFPHHKNLRIEPAFRHLTGNINTLLPPARLGRLQDGRSQALERVSRWQCTLLEIFKYCYAVCFVALTDNRRIHENPIIEKIME